MKIFVDIDETICFYKDTRYYPHAMPIQENIAKINKLYDESTLSFTFYKVQMKILNKNEE